MGSVDPNRSEAHRGRVRGPADTQLLERRLERERLARREAEEISETAIREAFERERGLKLLAGVSSTANRASRPDEVLAAAVEGVCAHTGWPVGHVYVPHHSDPDLVVPSDIWHLEPPADRFDGFVAVTMNTSLSRGAGLPGRVLESRTPHWIPDVTTDPNFPRAAKASEIGVRAAFALPVLAEDEVHAVLEFFTPEAREPDENMLELMAQVGTQVALVVERSEARGRLESLSRQHELLLSSAGDGICGLDAAGMTTFVNPAAAEMLGGDPAAMTGVPLHDLVHAPADDREATHGQADCGFTSRSSTGSRRAARRSSSSAATARSSRSRTT